MQNGTASISTDKYTVGWICSISTELTAATAFLDEKFDAREYSLPDDNNDYTLGRIGGHFVAITVLPGYGTASAAAVARDMMRSFSNMKIRLMVGIGGGAPTSKHDIRLGDVVVSVPENGKSGVLQYDFGKTIQNQEFQVTGVLNQPPKNLLAAVTGLRTDYESNGHQLEMAIDKAFGRSIKLRETYRRPDKSPDRLYKSDVIHPPNDDRSCLLACSNATSRVVSRTERPLEENIKIHYGLVASANQVMKDAITRDKLALQNEVLCFEMEAAGLMNDFSCLVIRGICDYSDSHKNKDWQGYAAMAAAAYAKDLLNRRRSIYLEPSRIIPDVLESEHSAGEYRPLRAGQWDIMFKSLYFEQIGARHLTIRNAHAKTCKWLLENQAYLDWLDPSNLESHHGFLWIKGKAGIGKSTLMKFALTNAQKKMKDKKIISFYFNARGEDLEKCTIGMYRSLLLQLFEVLPKLQNIMNSFSLAATREDYNWDIQQLKSLFEEAIRNIKDDGVVCFIDALDECDEDEIRDMISFFQNVGELTTSNDIKFLVCFSSRHYPHISKKNAEHLILEGQEGHTQDINNYLYSELKIGKSKLAENVRAKVQKKSAGIFMWVILVVEILNKEYDGGRIHKLRQRLDDIPEDLHQLFRNILTRDNYHKDELLLCIQWLLFSRQPLKPEELYFAVLSDPGPESVESWNVDEISMDDIKKFILSSSKGLAEITKSKSPTVQFIHESVKDFLLKEKGLKEICSDFGEEFTRKSHKRLKQLCLDYLNSPFKKYKIPYSLRGASSDQAKELRQQLLKEFPFTTYAVQSVLYHANAAEMDEKEQDAFFQTFNFDNWITLNNIFERFERRWLDRRVSQLYVLAIHNAGNMIRRHPSGLSCFKSENSRYGLPILAALVANSYDAVGAFLELHARAALSEDHPNASILHQLCNKYLNDSNKRKWDSRDFQYSQRKSFLSHLAGYGDAIITSFLLHWADVDVDVRDKLGDTALLVAARKGNDDVLSLLLRHHADITARDARGESPQHNAALSGHGSTMKILLEAGADVSAKDGQNRSSIHCAVAEGHATVVEVLLKAGADIEEQNADGESLLFIAALEGHEAVVQLLLNAGAEFEVKNKEGVSLLWAAAHKRNGVVFKMLVEAGADAKVTGRKGKLLLYHAVEFGYADIVEVLWKTGADVHIKGENGESLLHVAVARGNGTVVKFLLNAGADVKEQLRGALPLHMATRLQGRWDRWNEGRHTVVSELLLEDAASINERDGCGWTPLLYATKHPSDNIFGSWWGAVVQLLIQNGADIHAQTPEGETSLHLAVRHRVEEVAKILLEAGAGIEVRDSHGRTPLHYACFEGRDKQVRLLLENGADIEAKDKEGDTPLHKAVRDKTGPKELNSKSVELLIAHNANLRSRNNNNLTALEMAQNTLTNFIPDDRRQDIREPIAIIDLLKAALKQP